MPEEAYILDVRAVDQWLDTDGEPLGTFVGPRDGIVITVQDADRATAHVQGRVVGPDGPVEGAWFQIGDGRHLGTISRNTPGTERSGADGSFRIGPIPARRYRITVHAESAGFAKFQTEEFELSPHQVLDLGEVRVPQTARLVIDLRYRDGTPVRGALLQLYDPETAGSGLILRLDKEGHLDQEVLPGRFELTLYGGAFRTVRDEIEVAAGEDRRLEYRVHEAVPRAIRVAFPAGERSGTLVVRDPDGGVVLERELPVPPVGQRTFETDCSLGRHEVEFTGAGGARYAGSFEVTSLAPHQEPLDLVLLPRR